MQREQKLVNSGLKYRKIGFLMESRLQKENSKALQCVVKTGFVDISLTPGNSKLSGNRADLKLKRPENQR